MFSGQYMGTRVNSKSLPRAATPQFSRGPYTRLVSEAPSASTPVNANPRSGEDENDEIDYSFSYLPVRERRKMFLSGGKPPTLQPAGVRSMTMPHLRTPNRHRSRFETQSEYGGGDVEAPIIAGWSSTAQSTPNMNSPSRKVTSTGSILLTPQQRVYQRPVSPQARRVQYLVPAGSPRQNETHSPRSLSSPQPNIYPVPVRTQVPYQARVIPSNAGSRVYTVSRPRSPYASPRNVYGQQIYHTLQSPRVVGRVSQPLRVNVYNSDTMNHHLSPRSPRDKQWTGVSPIYPAYPAHMDRSYHKEANTAVDRTRRGKSAEPVRYCNKPSSPIVYRTETIQSWRPLQAPRWIEPQMNQNQARFVSHRLPPSMHYQVTPTLQEPVGVSEF